MADWSSLSMWIHSRIGDEGPMLVVVESAESMLVGDGERGLAGCWLCHACIDCCDLAILLINSPRAFNQCSLLSAGMRPRAAGGAAAVGRVAAGHVSLFPVGRGRSKAPSSCTCPLEQESAEALLKQRAGDDVGADYDWDLVELCRRSSLYLPCQRWSAALESRSGLCVQLKEQKRLGVNLTDCEPPFWWMRFL